MVDKSLHNKLGIYLVDRSVIEPQQLRTALCILK